MPPTEHRFPCRKCGASLLFQPGQHSLVCTYCGHRQDIDPGISPAQDGGRALQWDAAHKSPDLVELPLNDWLERDRDSDLTAEIRDLSCPNCGARIEMGGNLHSGQCPFCATPVVLDNGTARRIKPQGVLPFALTEAQAHQAMEDWLGSLWFAPSGLLAYARRGRKLTGIYAPFWTFDARTRTDYSGQRGDYYDEKVYVTQNVNGRSQRVAQQVRRVRWRHLSGQVSRDFNDVLVLASTSLPRDFGDGLAPWDLSQVMPYRPDYLSGLAAEGYTIALSDGHRTARQEMAGVILSDARRAIGGDEQRVEQLRTDHMDETFKHILLPIWIAAYRYNGKGYRFVVNGQSGRVKGERPWSIWKIAAAVIAVLIALAALLYMAEAGGYVQIGEADAAGDYQIRGY